MISQVMSAISQPRDEAVGRFELGTFNRIAQVLKPNETRSDFIRQAVAREIERREEERRRTVALENVSGWIG